MCSTSLRNGGMIYAGEVVELGKFGKEYTITIRPMEPVKLK